MIRLSFRCVMLAIAVSTFAAARVSAQPGPDGDGSPNGGPSVYQWHPSDGWRHDDRKDRRDFRRDSRFVSPQIQSGWFQRPYPYHLDYYKMRYGGSYAPYFGNLYGTPLGTPQVVNYPPYYGPYYTGNGAGPPNGYGQPGNGGAPMEYPVNPGAMMPGSDAGESIPTQTQSRETVTRPNADTLPVPTP